MNFSFARLLRTAFRNKGLTLINITGLSVGLAVAMFLLVYLSFEFSYDKHFKDADRIYRVISIGKGQNEVMTIPLTLYQECDQLLKEVPEVEYAARLFRQGGGIFETEEQVVLNIEGYVVDSSFLNIFDFPVVYGQLEGALNSVNQCVITRKYAEAFFGSGVNPVGKTLTHKEEKKNYQISAVIEDIPENTHFKFDILTKLIDLGYGSAEYLTYLKFKSGIDMPLAIQKAEEVTKGVLETSFAGMGYTFSSLVEPVASIHFSSPVTFDLKPKGNTSNLLFVSLVVLFILGIAISNFISLYIIQGEKRASEISIRKTNGAMRKSILSLLFGETFFVTFIAFVLAVILYYSCSEWFARFIHFNLPPDSGLTGKMWGNFVLLFVVVAILAGGYPAYYLSRFTPIDLIRKAVTRKYKLTAASVVLQFSIVIFCISALGVVMRQLDYVRNLPLGFEADQVLTAFVNSDIQQYEVLRNELMQYPEITEVGVGQGNIISGWSGGALRLPAQAEKDQIGVDERRIGPGFMNVFRVPVLEGRNFTNNWEAEKDNIILSESTVAALGLENPLGQKVISGMHTFTVIGVAKDIHYTSAHEKIGKMAYTFYATDYWNVSVRYKVGEYQQAKEKLSNVLKKLYPGEPFSVNTIRDQIQYMYVQDEVVARILSGGTIIAITLALLGLLALSGFVARQKRKEISVRRVMGAQVKDIIWGLNGYIIVRILPAIPLGIALSYYIMKGWLRNFAYALPLSWWIFAAALCITLFIVVLTIFYQSIRSATANPVNALKSE